MRTGFGTGAKRMQGGNNQSGFNAAPKRKVENLARTGTEYPLMKMSHCFIQNTPE
jgi:hypothetical protein